MEANLVRYMIWTNPAQALIASIWQGLLLTGFAWAALKLAPQLRASTRFWVWLIAFLLVALLPFFALAGSRSPAAALPQADHSLHLNAAWAFVLEGLWAIASLFFLGRLSIAGLQMRALVRNSTLVPLAELDPEIQAIVGWTIQGPAIEVRLSDAIDAPAVVGFLRPAVILPRGLWSELEPGELKQIVTHEKAHLDRGDDWTNLLQKLLRALCPLNPALLWAERHLCLEREQACDDAVLDAAGNPCAYATCLTKLAQSKLVRRAAALAPGLWKRHSELAGRVDYILHHRRTPRPWFARATVAACLMISLVSAVLLQRCPRMITFAAGEPMPLASLHVPIAPVVRYQEASFHPAEKRPSVPLKRRVAARKSYPSPIRVITVRDTDGSGTMTLILFTVDAPRTTYNWIVFQI